MSSELVQAIEEAMKWVNPLPCPECGEDAFPASGDRQYECAGCGETITIPTIDG